MLDRASTQAIRAPPNMIAGPYSVGAIERLRQVGGGVERHVLHIVDRGSKAGTLSRAAAFMESMLAVSSRSRRLA